MFFPMNSWVPTWKFPMIFFPTQNPSRSGPGGSFGLGLALWQGFRLWVCLLEGVSRNCQGFCPRHSPRPCLGSNITNQLILGFGSVFGNVLPIDLTTVQPHQLQPHSWGIRYPTKSYFSGTNTIWFTNNPPKKKWFLPLLKNQFEGRYVVGPLLQGLRLTPRKHCCQSCGWTGLKPRVSFWGWLGKVRD